MTRSVVDMLDLKYLTNPKTDAEEVDVEGWVPDAFSKK